MMTTTVSDMDYKRTVEMIKNEVLEDREEIRKKQKKYKSVITFNQLLNIYYDLVNKGEIEKNIQLEDILKTNRTRNNQGILVIALLMTDKPNNKELTCSSDCIYCPNVPGYSRSYFPGEPAVSRGKRMNWDPYLQVRERLDQYKKQHFIYNTEEELKERNIEGYKVDVIIEGGSYNIYPYEYRREFIRQIYYACNTYYTPREIKTLEEEKEINRTSYIRVIGLSVETQPKLINNPLMYELRENGVTRVQIGIQSVDDEVLKKNNRKNYKKDVIKATKILYDNGFKVSVHYMPDMYGTTIDKDKEMFKEVLSNPDLEFDYCKIYPCTVMEYSKLKDLYDKGEYKPYAEEYEEIRGEKYSKIVDVCKEIMVGCKKHQRIERMERDFPREEYKSKNYIGNLRQQAEKLIKEEGLECKEIRYREVKNEDINPEEIEIKVEEYEAARGKEYFISGETKDNLIGFLRLRIVDKDTRQIEELRGCGMIREIHIYGPSRPVGTTQHIKSYQNIGLGTKMLKKAEEIVHNNKLSKISVINGEGVAGFYEKRGFKHGKYYMIKEI